VADGSFETVRRTRSELTQALVRLNGKPFSFSNYPMFKAIYDGGYQELLMMTCRQVGKSTTLANFIISESIAVPHFKNYFLCPTQEQTHRFSSDRVGTTITYSPLIKKYFTNAGTSARVLSREFANGSKIQFSYATDDADRARGVSCDRLSLDEVQDMILSVVEPVVKECLNESDYKLMTWAGTPKTMENTIQSRWEASTQTEWVMKCEGCNAFNIIRSERSVGKLGPVCLKCGKYLNPRNGRWVDTNPGAVIKGFHVSRLMMPRVVPAAWSSQEDIEKATKEWAKVFAKLEGPNSYALSTFRNEVLGVSDSIGRRLVTIESLREAANGPTITKYADPKGNMDGVTMTCAGIDWSGGGTMLKSRTVLWVLGWVPKERKMRTLYYEIFPGLAPMKEVEAILAVLKQFPIQFVACDAGEGNMPADMLRNQWQTKRVFKIRYSGVAKKYIEWDKEGNFFIVNRTHSIDSLMSALNMQEIQFPKMLQGLPADTPPFSDILNEYEEVTKLGMKRWDHAADRPDDCLHAINFARIALQIATHQLNLTSKSA
jgi:phage terminase large subunit GpA-like protein